ncbi:MULTISPECIES: type IV toxin-antitoxin system AbiEi family antitoxin domain-containing protein [unclassified Ectothiorhodospira]|uniref:type IV toxin-antitoxin system AbiEi family antitoxin domain-containing protein n=1 Tax=unclassified Ectothiorhodospira TaxID=2684909 RepID=UPI001EE928B7|nr:MULTISPECIES: type IV toxin-antitoxin system AbiEi family antitoxin domain-containing protein [unclassified Ectothiorhodospira]MCG5516970.1 type IV toxin-antitoxin system AbiEi family antitoxin [Ectothiorhodospira sp. 9100]MCG5517499.1 type IV toxin-antitoxin system AbiEi family antitoxin [Ectothiorhodospira sp. 9905]
MNTSYTAHVGENTQAPIPLWAGEEPARTVDKNPDKVTISESLLDNLNYQVLAWVYKKCILLTMSDQNESKLNRLLAGLSDTGVVSSRWLRAQGYSSSLVVRYVDSGWLVSPARGVYMRKGGSLRWEGVVRTLQWMEGLSLHVGGRFALAWLGHEHYLRLGEAAVITLYGPDRVPGWVGKLPLVEGVEYCGKGPFDLPVLPLTDETSDQALLDQGLERREAAPSGMLVCSTPERAMLELCDEASDASGVYEVDALMQGMATLRPQRLEMLLSYCRSIKAKRLFLALAERHGHAWFSHLSLDGVDLGRGKRSLVSGGHLHPRYQITLPGDLDEQLG